MGTPPRREDRVILLELTADEALVLSDLLGRWQSLGLQRTVRLESDAEWHVLSGVLALLERRLAEPFMPDYAARVEAARRALIERGGAVEWSDERTGDAEEPGG